jgi:DNA (cytosine-5)-methyltransferase 1
MNFAIARGLESLYVKASPVRTIGLFAGIGGLELGFEKAGFETALMAESDPLCQAVLKQRFPKTKIVGDVADIRCLPPTDVLVAGFPCQPYSQVGLTKGLIAGAWHLDQIFRLLDSSRKPPPHIVLENVPFIVHLDRGQALKIVLEQLELRGYRWAYRIIDTAAFGLPQRRRRWFLVASLMHDPAAILLLNDYFPVDITDAGANGFYWNEGNRGIGWTMDAVPPLKSGSGIGIPTPPAIWDHERQVIWTPDVRDAERLQGFRAGWTKVDATSLTGTSRRRWRMIGNAVSVPVSRWIAERIRDAAEGKINGTDFAIDRLPKAAFFDGERRYETKVGAYPVLRKASPILNFLAFDPQPLSRRATHGFRVRYEMSPLQKNQQFMLALRHHERHNAA